MRRLVITGFTLVELMVTMSIMAILLAIAVPSFQTILTGMRMNGEINSLLTDMNFARSVAIKQGSVITVCPPSGTTCNTSTSSWSSGWMVYNTVTAQQLRITSGVTHGDTLTANPGGTPLTFSPIGYTQFAGTITLHDSNDDQAQRRCIQFNAGSWALLTGASCP